MIRPTLFIGSSTEALGIVDALHTHFEGDVEVIPWKFGIFKSGESALESLVNSLDNFDFAAFVLTPDDLVESRGQAQASPRDNVVFEMGLFIGRLGRERVFIMHERRVSIKIPTDLLGINTIRFGGQTADDYNALLRSTRPAFRELEDRMKALGLFPGVDPGKVSRYGMLAYSDSFRDRESHYRDIVDGAEEALYINGTALTNIINNSWGKLVQKSADIPVNLLMLDPRLAEEPSMVQLYEATYKPGVLDAAQSTLNKIAGQVEKLPEDRRGRIRVYLTRYLMPIAAVVADPESEKGRMVVEIIGASDSDVEYFSRPRYVLSAQATDVAMFKGYWEQVSLLFSANRAAKFEI